MSNRTNQKDYFVYIPEYHLTNQKVSSNSEEYWHAIKLVPAQPLKARTCNAAFAEAVELGYKFPIVGPAKGFVQQ